jgi:hypothetical protein
MRMHADGAPEDSKDEYLRMAESISVEAMYKFCRAVDQWWESLDHVGCKGQMKKRQLTS